MNEIGAQLSLAWGIPMACLLLSIAVVPLVAHAFWEKWYGWIGAFWALAFVIPAGFRIGWGATGAQVVHILVDDYFPFMVLIGSLFVISGGVVISGPFRGTPRSNAALLLAGTLCASAIGTTGASMLFIRPLLRANEHRRHRAHTMVFFIFLVANIGGSLTPLGDPPLFLGFLRGVGFFWTTSHLLLPTAFLTVALLAVYLVLDSRLLARERSAAGAPVPAPGERAGGGPVAIRVEGAFNLMLLVAVAGAVLASGAYATHPLFLNADGSQLEISIGPIHETVLSFLRSIVLIVLATISLVRTPRELREKNGFSWAPLEEVAILFVGIFVTMVPVLLILKAGMSGAFAPLIDAVRVPMEYFWVTGSVSAFLDNAPSYVVFFELAHSTPMAEFATRGPWGVVDPVDPVRVDMPSMVLTAISAGAVFMGAMTYIGNGPNFLVRSIAVRSGVSMPSFFGYILKWSVPILLPLLVALAFIFLR